MGFNWGKMEGAQIKGLMGADERSKNLDKIADGYANEVGKIMSGPAAPAIRNEVRKYVDPIMDSKGMEQYRLLGELGERVGAYKAFFGGMWEDKDERPALMLALVRHEKSLH